MFKLEICSFHGLSFLQGSKNLFAVLDCCYDQNHAMKELFIYSAIVQVRVGMVAVQLQGFIVDEMSGSDL